MTRQCVVCSWIQCYLATQPLYVHHMLKGNELFLDGAKKNCLDLLWEKFLSVWVTCFSSSCSRNLGKQRTNIGNIWEMGQIYTIIATVSSLEGKMIF